MLPLKLFDTVSVVCVVLIFVFRFITLSHRRCIELPENGQIEARWFGYIAGGGKRDS